MTPRATWSQTWASVTPIVSPGSSPTWRIALVTSSDVIITATSAYSPSPWKPSAART